MDDGLYRIFVNATVKDGSDVSELMDIFTKSDKYNYDKFPKTSARKYTFKERKEGQQEMSDIVREIAVKERQEGKAEGKAEAVDFILTNMGLSLQEACKALGITVEEYDNAKKHLMLTR